MPETYTDRPLLGDSFDRALALAVDHHRRQLRKGTEIPYVSHLLGVTSLVLEMGGSETEAIGALLHDTEPKPPWYQRKRSYLDAIAHKQPDELRVSLADKLHNARAILLDYRTHGDGLWDRFKTGEGDSIRWYYRSLYEAFSARRDALGERAVPALEELGRTVAEIDRLAGAR